MAHKPEPKLYEHIFKKHHISIKIKCFEIVTTLFSIFSYSYELLNTKPESIIKQVSMFRY
jgi:hypothetical protein